MRTLLTVSQVAKLANRSKSSVHRDIERGALSVTQRVPGYRGPFLVDEHDAADYAETIATRRSA